LLISDHEKLASLRLIDEGDLRLAGLLLLSSLLIGSAAMIVLGFIGAGLTAAGKVTADLIGAGLDLSVVLEKYLRGLIWPWRGITDKSIRLVQQGDLVALARRLSVVGQVTTIVVIAQGLLIFLAFAVLVIEVRPAELLPSAAEAASAPAGATSPTAK
jgi:hypothetical protein